MDVTEARVLVSIDVTKPLKFKKRVLMDNGEETVVSLTYEKLYRYCFTCFMISHEERDCPLLSIHQRQINRDRRSNMIVDRRESGVREFDGRRDREPRNEHRFREEAIRGLRQRDTETASEPSRENVSRSAHKEASHPIRQVRRNLYQTNEVEGPRSHRKPVWQRIGNDRSLSQPRVWESSTQSSAGAQREREVVSGESQRLSKQVENIKPLRSGEGESKRDSRRDPPRRRETSIRIRSPTRDDPNLEMRRSSRRPPRHQSRFSAEDPTSKNKGKGKAVAEEAEMTASEEDDEYEDAITAQNNFEIGSGSGTGRVLAEGSYLPPPPHVTKMSILAPAGLGGSAVMGIDAQEENGLSD